MAQLTDAQQAQQGKVVKLGLDQITKPTPMFLKHLFRFISAITGIWAIVYLAKPDGLNMEFANKVNSWLVLALPALHYLIKLFGWSLPEEAPEQRNY